MMTQLRLLLCICLFLIGFYCPLGSFTPLPCPKGTYEPTAGAVSIDSCLKCPPHHYCPRPGLSACLPCGPVAQQPLSGQDTCVCPGEGHSFQVTVFSPCVPPGVFMWSCSPRFISAQPPTVPVSHLIASLCLIYKPIEELCVTFESSDTSCTLIWE